MTDTPSPTPASPQPSSTRRKRWWLLGALLVMACALWLTGPTLLQWWGRYLACGRPLQQPVDVVFVLGGDVQTRPFVAAEIYSAGFAKQILISQPKPHSMDFLGGLTEGELLSQVLQKLDVPAEKIVGLPLEVDSSRAELEALRKYIDQYHPQRVAIVTNDFHTRRVSVLAQRICRVTKAEILLVGAPCDDCTPADWYRDEEGLATYLLETIKLVSVWLGAG